MRTNTKGMDGRYRYRICIGKDEHGKPKYKSHRTQSDGPQGYQRHAGHLYLFGQEIQEKEDQPSGRISQSGNRLNQSYFLRHFAPLLALLIKAISR